MKRLIKFCSRYIENIIKEYYSDEDFNMKNIYAKFIQS